MAELSRPSVKELSRRLQEPDWLRLRRLGAWEAFESLDWPTGFEEDWRRTDPKRFAGLDFAVHPNGHPPSAPSGGELPDLFGQPVERAGRAGTVRQCGFRDPDVFVTEEAKAAGVVLTSLRRAFSVQPDLVRQGLLSQVIDLGEGKLEALHSALIQDGLLVQIPAGVELKEPLFGLYWHADPEVAAFRHVVVHLAEGASATLVDWCASAPEAAFRASRVSEIHVGPNARLRYLQIQNWGSGVLEWSRSRAVLERDASVHWLSANLGGKLVKAFLETRMTAPGSHAKIAGAYFVDGKQHVDLHSIQDHVSGNASSDLLFHGALAGKARAVYRGVIRIHKEAQKSDAYQKNRNLFLSDGARADSIPTLEIEADDVRCTHGATAADLDSEDLFYLCSRGVSRAEARRLLVEGFFRPALDRVSVPEVDEELALALAEKLRRNP